MENEGSDEKEESDAIAQAESVAQVAKTVSEVHPIKALFGPAAKAYGDHWGERVQQWVNSKKSENAKRHAEAVLGDTSAEDIPDKVQLDLLSWYEKAGNVDPEKREESAAIRAALKATLAGDDDDAALLISLSKAEILCLLGYNPDSRTQYAYLRLSEKHLAVQESAISRIISTDPLRLQKPLLFRMRATAISFLFCLTIPLFTLFFISDLSERQIGNKEITLVLAAAFIGLVAVGLFTNSLKDWRFTSQGLHLSRQIRKYLGDAADQPDARAESRRTS
ncbi:hypothetical protein [Nisaea sediminum]|uniref:hypothetical protein n=1 Tax=Nisaea sediminum TaxID=2775867 RepID=UPI00186809FC|nr:hypothetical protein [Nisaea sediminum]